MQMSLVWESSDMEIFWKPWSICGFFTLIFRQHMMHIFPANMQISSEGEYMFGWSLHFMEIQTF